MIYLTILLVLLPLCFWCILKLIKASRKLDRAIEIAPTAPWPRHNNCKNVVKKIPPAIDRDALSLIQVIRMGDYQRATAISRNLAPRMTYSAYNILLKDIERDYPEDYKGWQIYCQTEYRKVKTNTTPYGVFNK